MECSEKGEGQDSKELKCGKYFRSHLTFLQVTLTNPGRDFGFDASVLSAFNTVLSRVQKEIITEQGNFA